MTSINDTVDPSATTTVFLPNVIQLRAEKASLTSNDEASSQSSVETLTVLENVSLAMARKCCAALCYYVRLAYGLQLEANLTADDLTEEEREQHQLMFSVTEFDQYVELCREIVESVLSNVKQVYALYNAQRRRGTTDSTTGTKTQLVVPGHVNSAAMEVDNDDDDVEDDDDKRDRDTSLAELAHESDLRSMYEMLRHMDGIFKQFYEIFTNDNCFPRNMIRDKLFVSVSMSARQPVIVQRCHLRNLTVLLGTLANATGTMTAQCNTVFEAFFCGGFFIMCLLDMMMTATSTAAASSASVGGHWTRVRLTRPEDRESIPLLKNTTSPEYQRAITALSADVFDPISDVYLSKSDTLSTLFGQFLGRVFLRLYEWPLREDVMPHISQHFLPQSAQSMFSVIGRGPDQKAWIRFFKRNSDRQPKIFVRVEPLLQMNDELMCGAETAASSGGGISGPTTAVTTRASPDTVQRYHMLRDFLRRFNEFCAQHDRGRSLWSQRASAFAEVCGKRATNDEGPLVSYATWCNDVNSLLFPYNFLLLAGAGGNGTDGQQQMDAAVLADAWTYRAQQYLMNKRFTTTKCKQLLEFLQRLEVKSRLLFDEQQFMFLFSNAMDTMPFLYGLFGDPDVDQTTATADDIDL